MRLDLTVPTGKPYAVYVNGNLIAEGMGGDFQGIPDLEKRITETRASTTMVKAMASFIRTKWADERDHINASKDRLRAAAEGLIDGLNGVTQRFACYEATVPDAPGRAGHKGGPSYNSGYDLGKWMLRCVETMDKARASQ